MSLPPSAIRLFLLFTGGFRIEEDEDAIVEVAPAEASGDLTLGAAILMAQGREEKKIPVMKMSGLGVSIKRPHIEEEQRNPSSNSTAAHQAAQPEEDYIFNERDLNYYWQEYAGRMPKEQVAIAKRMQNMRITLINDTTFEAVVDNEIVKYYNCRSVFFRADDK